MVSKHTVLYNILNGLFIIPSQYLKYYDEDTNQEIPAYTEILILNEYANTNFIRLNDFVQKAETISFFFYRFEEEKEDDITWIEVKNAEPIIQ